MPGVFAAEQSRLQTGRLPKKTAIAACVPAPSPASDALISLPLLCPLQLSGTVVQVMVENGDAVLPGQPLMIIRP